MAFIPYMGKIQAKITDAQIGLFIDEQGKSRMMLEIRYEREDIDNPNRLYHGRIAMSENDGPEEAYFEDYMETLVKATGIDISDYTGMLCPSYFKGESFDIFIERVHRDGKERWKMKELFFLGSEYNTENIIFEEK